MLLARLMSLPADSDVEGLDVKASSQGRSIKLAKLISLLVEPRLKEDCELEGEMGCIERESNNERSLSDCRPSSIVLARLISLSVDSELEGNHPKISSCPSLGRAGVELAAIPIESNSGTDSSTLVLPSIESGCVKVHDSSKSVDGGRVWESCYA